MSSPRAAGSDGDNREAAVAKMAGFVVFSGIAMSILKALNPLNKNKHEPTQPLSQSTRPSPPPRPQPIAKSEPSTCTDPSEPNSTTSRRTIDIVKGDTLWGLSREYGVSIDAIKEANGLSGDTIYAGKKLVIP